MLPYSHHHLNLLQPKLKNQHDAHQCLLQDVGLALSVFTNIVTALDDNLQWFHVIVNLKSSCQTVNSPQL